MAYSSDDDDSYYDYEDEYEGEGEHGYDSSDDDGDRNPEMDQYWESRQMWMKEAVLERNGGGGGGAKKKEDEVYCECKKCRETELGKHKQCSNPTEYFERARKIEKQQLAEYTERNGHLATADPQRHACGNGAVESRRHCILTHKDFCVHTPNPSAPMPYMTTDGGSITHVVGRPTRPGEVRNDDKFRDSFKTPEGMTVQDYRRLIDDYHIHQEQIDTPFAAFPRHHALAMASLSSTCATLELGLWATRKTGLGLGDRAFDLGSTPMQLRTDSTAYFQRAFGKAKQHAQNPAEITRFTEMSGMQRNMVLAHSGITGLVISRLFSPQYNQTHMMCVKQSRIVARRVHSTEECEILADNRYGKAEKYVGNPDLMYANILSRMMPDFKTQTLETARAELRVLYSREIQNILGLIRRLKRGLINADEIRAMPEYHRMYSLWMYYLKAVMSKHQVGDEELRVKLVVDVIGVAAEFPLMYSTEMLSIYSRASAKLVKVAIKSALRMCANGGPINRTMTTSIGCRAGILAFAAVEPRMVDQYLVPQLSICGFDGNDNSEALQNHVPSRCPIFGELRKKFQVHMPRTGDCEWEICRKNGGKIRSFCK